MTFGSAYKLQKQGMRAQGAGEQFWMKLSGDEERMHRVIEDLHDSTIQRHTTKEQPSFFESGFIGVIELVAMTEALAHYILAIEALHTCTRYEQDVVASQSLRTTQVTDLLLLWEQRDERFWRMGL